MLACSTADFLKRLSGLFEVLDSSDDLTISRVEFRSGMVKKIGFQGDSTILEQVMQEIDDDASNKLGFDEFDAWNRRKS